ncbi:MAG: HEAT repeat domain-containing protein [Acidobacteria bacterium]|nr:HEAT repeat domain-containing protein [Acidobacteriota bacterium]
MRSTRRRQPGRTPFLLLACLVLAARQGAGQTASLEPAGPQTPGGEQIQRAIDRLGELDYQTRTEASRTLRRAAPAAVVPALLAAVDGHADGYVRYRALVLLTGFNDPRTIDAMRESLKSPNDRLRTVAFSYFEHHPDAALAPELVAALDREQGEFVRPALVRALASLAGSNAAARAALVPQIARGEDFFRSVVIEALGDYRAAYAYDDIAAVAALDGPLQDDAVLALGKIGDPRALEILAGLQKTAPRAAQPTIAGAICLLGVNCGPHQGYLVDALEFADANSGYQALLRSAATALGALAAADHREAADALFRIGIPSRDPTRAPVALALATVALRNTPLALALLEQRPDRDLAIDLLAEGFDMLEEDFEKERFFAAVRRAYWDAPDGSPRRALMQTLIGVLDF